MLKGSEDGVAGVIRMGVEHGFLVTPSHVLDIVAPNPVLESQPLIK
jgi:hypothetical protein